MAQVFVSYKREDISEDFIQHLRKRLELAGYDVWIDKELLLPGEEWKREIDNAIKASFALIVLMTPAARESEYVTYEWAFAVGRGTAVIPIIIEKTDLHPRLNDLQFADFTNAWSNMTEGSWQKILAKLQLEVTKIGETKIPLIISQAISDLNSLDIDKRKNAIEVLKKSYPNPIAMNVLTESLQHIIDDVREEALHALAELQYVDASREIVTLLDDTSMAVKRAAIVAIWHINIQEAIPKLIAMLENKNLQYHIIVALGKLRAKSAIPYLREILISRENNRNLLQNTIGALGEIGDITISDDLVYYLNHKEDQIRRETLEALVKIKSQKALPKIIEISQSKNDPVRVFAIQALGDYDIEEVIHPLSQLGQDSELNIKKQALNALGRINSNMAVQSFITNLKQLHIDDQRSIIENVERHGSEIIKQAIRNYEDT